MPQSNHRKKGGGGINEREPSAFIAYTYDSKTMPPCKIQSAKHKVLDEITGFARSRHPVKVYCYQWTTSNFIERGPGVEPGFGAATPTMLLQKHRFRTNRPPYLEQGAGFEPTPSAWKAESSPRRNPALIHHCRLCQAQIWC